jgi:hypothetical protein
MGRQARLLYAKERSDKSNAVPRTSALHNRLIIQAITGKQAYHQSITKMPQLSKCVTSVTTVLRPGKSDREKRACLTPFLDES